MAELGLVERIRKIDLICNHKRNLKSRFKKAMYVDGLASAYAAIIGIGFGFWTYDSYQSKESFLGGALLTLGFFGMSVYAGYRAHRNSIRAKELDEQIHNLRNTNSINSDQYAWIHKNELQ